MAYEDVVRTLDDEQIVAIVTTRQNGGAHVTPIWSMVVDGVPYIRSAYGTTSWWYKHVVAERPVSFALGDGSIAERDRAAALALPREPVTLTPIPVGEPIQNEIDEEIERKYAGSLRSSIDAMLAAEAVACTFRVDPVL